MILMSNRFLGFHNCYLLYNEHHGLKERFVRRNMRNVDDSHQNSSKLIAWLVVLPLLVLLGIDTFGNPETVAKLIGIHSFELVIPALLILILYRLKWGPFLGALAQKLMSWGLVVTFTIGSFLTLFDAVTPPNAVYALTRLHQDQICLIALVLGIVLLSNQVTRWWETYWRRVLFALPFIVFYFAFLTSLFPFDVFLELVKEDRLVEYGQFCVLLSGTVISLFISLRFKKIKQQQWFWFFAVCSALFFFIAGDEISWGQRIIGLEVNETVKQINRQSEITVHNLYAVEWLVVYGYFGLSLFGLASKVVSSRLPHVSKLAQFTPSGELFGYFLLPLIFYAGQITVLGGIWHPWAEVAELFLYSGIVLWILLMGRERLALYKS